MTVMIAEEAGSTAVGERAAARRVGGRTSQGRGPAPADRPPGRLRPSAGSAPSGRNPRRGGRTQQGSQPKMTGGRTQQGTQGDREVKPGPVDRQQRQGGQRKKSRQFKPPKMGSGGGTSYQTVILAEFVAAVLLVAATPFAKRESPGISPYAGQDLLQLVAITIVYFLLALVSGINRGTGRFAAWFGLLILITVGLGEAVRLAKLFSVFGLASGSAPAARQPVGTSQQLGTHTAGGRG